MKLFLRDSIFIISSAKAACYAHLFDKFIKQNDTFLRKKAYYMQEITSND